MEANEVLHVSMKETREVLHVICVFCQVIEKFKKLEKFSIKDIKEIIPLIEAISNASENFSEIKNEIMNINADGVISIAKELSEVKDSILSLLKK